jgi:hypothetical protein
MLAAAPLRGTIIERVSLGGANFQLSPWGTYDGHTPVDLSATGRFATFVTRTDATGLGFDQNLGQIDVYLRDRVAGHTELISVGTNGLASTHPNASSSFGSSGGFLSDDGRFVAFSSINTNVMTDSTVGSNPSQTEFAYLRDRQNQQTVRVSIDSQGNSAPGVVTDISGNGRYVVLTDLTGQ